jgi:hypothetical protein
LTVPASEVLISGQSSTKSLIVRSWTLPVEWIRAVPLMANSPDSSKRPQPVMSNTPGREVGRIV